MSYNRNDDDSKKEKHLEDISFGELEKDDLEIKSYLNSSLDLMGVYVSEDLISKTLAAIKQADTENQESNSASGNLQQVNNTDEAVNHKKDRGIAANKVTWRKYIRRFAGVAAAVLVLTAGINFTKMGAKLEKGPANGSSAGYDMKTAVSDTADTSTSTQKQDGAAGAASTQEAPTVTQAALAPEYNANLFRSYGNLSKQAAGDSNQKEAVESKEKDSAASAANEDRGAGSLLEKPEKASFPLDDMEGEENDSTVSGTGNNSDSSYLEDNKLAQGITPPALGLGQKKYIDFTDFFLKDEAQAEYIKITDMLNNTEITLTAQSDIADFYEVMEQQQYTGTVNLLTTDNYSIKVKSRKQEGIAYSILIGDSIMVNDNTGYTVKQSNYTTDDIAALVAKLDEFFHKLSQ